MVPETPKATLPKFLLVLPKAKSDLLGMKLYSDILPETKRCSEPSNFFFLESPRLEILILQEY